MLFRSLRSVLGLANQLASFLPNLAHVTQPLRDLLRKNTAYVWTQAQEESFQELKSLLTSPLVTQSFNPSKDAYVISDASRSGLGYLLIQKNDQGNPVLVQAGSKSLSPAEFNYSVSEIELTAVVFAMSKLRHYLLGAEKIYLLTDHKPLCRIISNGLENYDFSPRLRRLKERLTPYNLQVTYLPGEFNASDRKSTRLNSSHSQQSRMPSSA